MRKAERLWSIGAAAVLAATFATSAVAQTTVTMWSFLDPNRTSPREKALKQIIENFESRNPGIKIKVEPQDFAQMPVRFFVGHRTGGNPDVVWINTVNLGALIQSDSGADLNALFVNKWTKAEKDDFFVRQGWTALERGNRLHAVPINHGASVIYYRKDLLRKAGIDPASLKTWDSIREAAKKLNVVNASTGRNDVWGFGMPLSPIKTESSPVVISLIDQKDPVFNGCTPNYQTADGIRALEYVKSLILTDKVTPQESLTLNVDDITDQFAAGRYAIAITASLRYPSIAGAATFDKNEIGIIPWPTWSGDHAGPMPVSGWWLVAWNKSPRLAEAGKFVEHMVSKESIELLSTVGGQVPIRRSSLEGSPVLNSPENAWMKTMVDAWAANSWIEPTQCNTQSFQAGLNEAVHRVIAGTDAKTALAEAERKFKDAQ